MAGLALAAASILAAWAERRWGWSAPALRALAGMFTEAPFLAPVREPSQLPLMRMHLAILAGMTSLGLLAAPLVRRSWAIAWAVFCAGYAIRAIAWIVGGNLPLVPGDSSHYVEIAASIVRGEGPVKHYVESFFRDYPEIRKGRGVLDDWATPLYPYILALAYRITGVVPGRALEETVAVAKGVSFLASLLALPAIYGFGGRLYGVRIGLGAMSLLAVLPVHAIYAGFALRESTVALTTLLAVWALLECWNASGWRALALAALGGVLGGLAILARNTAMAVMAAAGLYGLVVYRRRALGPLIAWSVAMAVVIAPWAWATYMRYGEPFYTYTKYFPYNLSWTIHHVEKGNTRPSEFYTAANAPEIVRVKVKSLLIILVYSTMILGLPLMLACLRRIRRSLPGERPTARATDRLVALVAVVFVAATLTNVADVTQVAQLGRYYLPVFVLALPMAAAGLRDAAHDWGLPPAASPWLGLSLVALLWADPTWAYDAGWFVRPFQLRWAAFREAGDWIRSHPEAVPEDARIMAWFPWEVRLTSGRTTVLMPRVFARKRIRRVIAQYNVTHVLWGSFEEPPHAEPVSWAEHLELLREELSLTPDREVFHSRQDTLFPVRLFRIR